jgi:aminoglycoside 6'-N-acetyltransferase I
VPFHTRFARPEDAAAWCRLRHALWPDESDEHQKEVAGFFAGDRRFLQAVIVAEDDRSEIVGFAELSLRPYAEGCGSSPVGFLEGWYVVPEMRRQGVGGALVRAGEAWARDQGCTELASDTEVENTVSAAAHGALGFEEVVMIRCFRKQL